MDFAGTTLTSAEPAAMRNLADFLGVQAADPAAALEGIQTALGVDFRRVGALIEPPSSLSRPLADGEFTDSWGITRRWTGLYYDIVDPPLKNAGLSDLAAYPWPDAREIPQAWFDGYADDARRLSGDTDYVVVAEHPVYGYLEMGCWLCGYDDFLYRLLADGEFVRALFGRYHAYVREVTERYYRALGPWIHVTTSGDDFGMQSAPFLSPECFRELLVPWYKERIGQTKSLTRADYFHHTCGSVYRLLDDICAMGVDILNPIQPGALEMEPERLKKGYGSRLIFWGGIDEQVLLTRGTESEVEDGVRRVAGAMSRGGRFVAAPSHKIQVDVPPRNTAAMYRALEAFA
jgi:uroporphyrinogen decarboxylase